tara:strand:+ start:1689 stop:1958 length:270 start_codon:yes stop_codon:yes gene_type:complete
VKIFQIINGHVNELLGINAELSEYRIENACKKCKVSHDKDGVFQNRCLKYRGGCGCRLPAATALKKKKCPRDVWYDNTINLDQLKKLKI